MLVSLVLLSACIGAKDVASFSLSWNTETVVDGETITLPTIRRFIDNDSGELRIQNDGTTPLEFSSVELPEWLETSVDFPMEVPVGEVAEIDFSWVSSTIDGNYSGAIQLQNADETLFTLHILGEVEPYIQVSLRELPDVYNQIEEEFVEQNLVGAVVGIVEGQDIIFLEGFGYADLENEVLVDPFQHRFRWASVAKSIASVLTLQLVEEGALSLDDSITDLYPGYQVPSLYLPANWNDADSAEMLPEGYDNLTLRMLLSHTGCVQHYSNGLVDPEPLAVDRNNPETNTGMEWALEYWIDAPLICIPGTDFSYSTFGYNLAGVTLEKVTETDFGVLVTDRVSSVVGSQTLLPDRYWDPAPDRVKGYNRSNGVISLGSNSDVSWKLAGGGFISTPEDLARYCAGLLGDVLISPQLRDEELWQPQDAAGEYGLGFYIVGDYISHSGSQQSARTGLFIDRGQNRCVIAMSNSTWADPFELIWAAL